MKKKLFSAYCKIIYLCSLLVSFRKRCMRQFIVSYNNWFRTLRSLPMRCSASAMFPTFHYLMLIVVRQEPDNISLRCRLDVSFNLTTHSVIHSDVGPTCRVETEQHMDCDCITS